MSNKVKIICDSTCDLEKEYLKQHDIEVLPLGINFNDEHYEDGINISVEELYNKVAEKNILPKTSAVSIAKFEKRFTFWVNNGYDILMIPISSLMSSCYQNACIAKEELNGHVMVFDSYNLSSGIGLLIIKAIEFKEQGMNLQQIYEELKKIVLNVRSQFIVDKLDYLYKGGRCSSLSFLFGKTLHIHPIIRVKEGKMIVYKKVRGSMEKGLSVLVDIFKEDLQNLDLDHVMITHSLGEEYVPYLYNELSKIIKKESIMITRAGSVISSHCGRGTIGILYIVK